MSDTTTSEPEGNKPTLQELNKLYQQRFQDKKKKALGVDKYNEQRREYMRKYREQRNKKEGYVKPERVKKPPKEPVLKAMIQPETQIILKPVADKKMSRHQEADLDLQRLKLAKKKLSDKSIENYVNGLQTIHALMTNTYMSGDITQDLINAVQGRKHDIKKLKDTLWYFKKDKLEATLNQLKDKYKKANTFKAKVNSITALLGRIEGFETEYRYISDLGKTLQAEYTATRDLNEATEEELAIISKIKFDNKSIMNNLKQIDDLRDQVIYGLYMYIPRRLEMRTVRIRYNSDKNTDKGNYLIVYDAKSGFDYELIFNDYKTALTYNKQRYTIPKEIKSYLEQYLQEQKLKTDDYLFHLDRNKREALDEGRFSVLFKKVFEEVYDVPITNQTLRIAYATYWTPRAKNVAEKKKIAEYYFSHDVVTNEQYIKTNVKK